MKFYNIKKFIFSVLLLCLVVSVNLTAFAEPETKSLSFTVPTDTPNTLDQIMYLALKKIGYNITITATGMYSAITLANSGEKDGLIGQTKGLADTYKNLVSVPESLFKVNFVVMGLEGNQFKASNWNDLRGKKVGFLTQKYYILSHLPNGVGELVIKEDTSQLFDALKNGEVECIVYVQGEGQRIPYPKNFVEYGIVDTTDSYIFLNKKNKELIPELEQVFKQMKADGTIEKILYGKVKINDLTEPTKPVVVHLSSLSSDKERIDSFHRGFDPIIGKYAEQYCLNLNAEWFSAGISSSYIMASMLREDFIARVPDVVVVSDNNSLKFVNEYYHLIFQDIPIVFTGAVLEDDLNDEILKNFTGLNQTIDAKETVDQMLKIFPKTENIFVINDYTKSGRIFYESVKKQLAPYHNSINIIFNKNEPIDDLLGEINNLPENSAILCGEYFTDSTGRFFTVKESQSMISYNANIPNFGLLDSNIGYGQLGGKYPSTEKQGAAAANLVVKILQGTSVSELPIDYKSEGISSWLFDNTMLMYYNIDPKILPADSIIINQHPDVFSKFFIEFLLGAIFIIALIGVAAFFLYSNNSLQNGNKNIIEQQKGLYTQAEVSAVEAQILDVKERLQSVIGSAPIGFAILSGTTVLEVNESFKRMIGILPQTDIKKYLAEESDLTVGERIIKFKALSGADMRFGVNIVPIEWGESKASVIWAIDIEETEYQKDTLLNIQSDLQNLMEALPMALLIIDPVTLSIRYANKAFLEFFEIQTLDTAVGIDMMQFCPEKQPSGKRSYDLLEEQYRQAVNFGRINTWDFQYVLPSGKILEVQSTEGAISYEGSQAIAVILNDIGDRKLHDRMLKNMVEKEKEANLLKGRFLMNMSHEIRTPMNAIIGLSGLQLLRKDEYSDDKEFESFKKINQSAKSLLAIINNILDYSRIEADKVSLIKEKIVLEDAILDAVREILETASEKQLKVTAKIATHVPSVVMGDKTRLVQVLKNILDNAVKFTDEGLVSLNVKLNENRRNIFVLNFEIQDTGIGMSEDNLTKIFVPFEQFHSEIKNYTGTGLGASISNEIIKLMGGTVEITSKLGIGTTVSINIPFSVEGVVDFYNKEKTLVLDSGTRSAMNQYRYFPNAKVLLCEDNIINQEVAKGILGIFKITPDVASNGEEALRMLLHKDYDLILMDIQMPVMDGYAATKIIRADKKYNTKVPIVAMTGNTLDEELNKCKDVGINSHIAKPINIDQLYLQLEKWL